MSWSLSVAAVALAASTFASSSVSHFPDSYFEAHGKAALQRLAVERWPGPTQLLRHWERSDLERRERLAILLGASAWHDPVLLPIYREAIMSSDERMRMAAAYGYRELLADARPDVTGGVSLAQAEQLAAEIDAVAATLRTRPLVELWLQSLLANEGSSMPGWNGVTLRRPLGTSLRAVEQVLQFDDFALLATAYRVSDRQGTRLNLVRLLEAVTLQQFLVMPEGERAGWGYREIDKAFQETDLFLEYWLDLRCVDDPEPILVDVFRELGGYGVDPMGANSYDVWLRLLKNGPPAWHMMAARSLFNLGGRWSRLTVFGRDSKEQAAHRDELIEWYRMLPPHILKRR
jgi:hypothetical protein